MVIFHSYVIKRLPEGNMGLTLSRKIKLVGKNSGDGAEMIFSVFYSVF